jgi:hypothetical protein
VWKTVRPTLSSAALIACASACTAGGCCSPAITTDAAVPGEVAIASIPCGATAAASPAHNARPPAATPRRSLGAGAQREAMIGLRTRGRRHGLDDQSRFIGRCMSSGRRRRRTRGRSGDGSGRCRTGRRRGDDDVGLEQIVAGLDRLAERAQAPARTSSRPKASPLVPARLG